MQLIRDNKRSHKTSGQASLVLSREIRDLQSPNLSQIFLAGFKTKRLDMMLLIWTVAIAEKSK